MDEPSYDCPCVRSVRSPYPYVEGTKRVASLLSVEDDPDNPGRYLHVFADEDCPTCGGTGHPTGEESGGPGSAEEERLYVAGLEWALDMLLRFATQAQVKRIAEVESDRADKILEIHAKMITRRHANLEITRTAPATDAPIQES